MMSIEKLREDRTCGNCKYWQRSSFPLSANYGKCKLSKMRTCATQIEMMSTACELSTYKDFGCNQFVSPIELIKNQYCAK